MSLYNPIYPSIWHVPPNLVKEALYKAAGNGEKLRMTPRGCPDVVLIMICCILDLGFRGYRSYILIIGFLLRLYRDNGKEDGNY